MFSIDSPACDIHRLTEYLKAQHQPNHIYRGQTADYGSLVSSVFRKKKIRTWNHFCICSEDGYAIFSDLEIVKHRLMQMLMQQYGRRFGAYLAQQYLARSEVIDVTENLDVAAFFATMAYPDYLAPVNDSDSPGVIYRFDRSQYTSDWTEGPFGDRKGRPVSDSGEPVSGASEVSIFVKRESRVDWSPEEFYAARQLAAQNFVTTAAAVTYSEMQPLMADKVPAIWSEIANIEQRRYADVNTPLPFLRPIAQRGGIIAPGYLWSCLVPEKLDRPLTSVWGDQFLGVEDIYGRYGMQAFYFHHRGKAPEFTRNVLWPNVGEDQTFFVLGSTVAVSREDLGIRQGSVHMADIVDIGFTENVYVDFAEFEDDLPG